MGRKHQPDSQDPIADLLTSLGLDPSAWRVSIDYTKGVLSGGRGVVVEVTHLPSRTSKRRSVRATTKRDARTKALSLARELLMSIPKP